MPPQLLIAGHIVKDITAEGWTAGGGALYAAAQAARLGVETAVVTACERDIDPSALVPGVDWRVVHVDEGIRFENSYRDGVRTQRVRPCERVIRLKDIPEAWRGARMVLLEPVFHDVDPSLPATLASDGSVLATGAQGWLRRLEGDVVRPGPVDARPPWLRGDICCVSEEDVEDPETLGTWSRHVPIVVLTRGRGGCTLWDASGRHDFDAAPASEEDPTGAGDVFAAAFVVRYSETGDAGEAARFALAAGAIAVEGRGIEAVGDRASIERRMGVSGVKR